MWSCADSLYIHQATSGSQGQIHVNTCGGLFLFWREELPWDGGRCAVFCKALTTKVRKQVDCSAPWSHQLQKRSVPTRRETNLPVTLQRKGWSANEMRNSALLWSTKKLKNQPEFTIQKKNPKNKTSNTRMILATAKALYLSRAGGGWGYLSWYRTRDLGGVRDLTGTSSDEIRKSVWAWRQESWHESWLETKGILLFS